MLPYPSVLFVCLHGSAKSLVAARHLERAARARGIELSTASAGLEPDATIPGHVISGMARDGFDVATAVPAIVTRELIASATQVVTFGCDLGDLTTRTDIISWGHVPAVSDGYDDARTAILEQVNALLDQLAGPQRSPARDGRRR